MAEIKSTLDLVMERTRNLSFSDEEKRDLEIDKAQKAFNGLLVKYADQILTTEELKREMGDLLGAHKAVDRKKLAETLMEKIDLEALAGPMPPLLETLFDCSITGIDELGKAYRSTLSTLSEDHRQRLKSKMENIFRISGTAVIPSVESDDDWKNEATAVRDTFEKRLNEEKNRLMEEV